MAEQFRFVSSLRSDIRKNLTVRLHAAYGDMLGEEDLRWRNFDKSINLNYGKDPIRNLWQESRLIVHSYDSTGLLETLEANIPSVAFWQNGLDHLVADAIPYYELLVDAGIVLLTPESAANRINGVWGDVANWWDSSEVQKARKIFCSQYARTSKKPIRDLKKIFLENI
jgi:putative transferase (TIGR04331 family)